MTYHDDPASEQEREPLLTHEDEAVAVYPHQPFIHEAHSPRTIIAIMIFVIFVLSFASTLMGLPTLRIYEDIICHRYYEGLLGAGHIGLQDNIDEGLCKGDAVQNELNIVLGVTQFITAIPGMLVAIPYGLLADRIGRKPVFALLVVGYVLSGLWNMIVMWFWRVLPLRLVWIAPIFFLIGGGDPTAGAVYFAIGSDVTTEANRANVFLLGSCAGQLAILLGPSVAASLMPRSPWIPLLLGYIILVLGSLSVVFIPETLHLHASKSATLVPDSSSERSPSPTRKNSIIYTVKSHVSGGVQKLRDSASVLTLPIIILLSTFIAQPFSIQSDHLFVRYVSKRFGWTLAKTGFLISLRSGISIVLFILIIPGISQLLINRLHYSSMAKDLSLARVSVTCAAVGIIGVAASPSIHLVIIGLVIWTFGNGFTALCRALVTSLVDKEHVARLYSIIAIVETAGALAAGPIFAGLYSLGLKLKEPWIGLPFYALGLIYVFAGLSLVLFGFLTRAIGNVHDREESETSTNDPLSSQEGS